MSGRMKRKGFCAVACRMSCAVCRGASCHFVSRPTPTTKRPLIGARTTGLAFHAPARGTLLAQETRQKTLRDRVDRCPCVCRCCLSERVSHGIEF